MYSRRREAKYMAYATVNGAEIYHELRGSGPPLLFICGAFADVGHFAEVADLLSDQFTVVTYERRGNSRSGGGTPGTPTSADAQADDAAALLQHLSLGPAAVYGNSSGAIIALNLAVRHPEAVSAAIFHEPPLNAGLAKPEEVGSMLGGIIESGMAAGGPPAAAEAFLRFAIGDENWEAFGDEAKERARANADIFFGSEVGNIEPYSPSDSELAAVRMPVEVLVSESGPPFFGEIAPWLAGKLGCAVATVPGTHTPQLDHPTELAQHVREFFSAVPAGA